MIDISKFKTRHESKKQLGFFTDAELEGLKGKLPEEAITFLKEEGKCTYNNDFLWTTLPGNYHEMLDRWGLEGEKCYVFMYSSFGSLVYFYKDTYYALNSFTGVVSDLMNMLKLLLNSYMSSDLILEGTFWLNLHEANRMLLPDLNDDEMYALVPAIPLGGNPEISKIEVVKMREHLAILAELYAHKVIME